VYGGWENEVPTIKIFANCRITMYFGDHGSPHFHIRMTDGREAVFLISSSAPLAGEIPPRDIQEALNWAKANVDALMEKWRELR
jgi:hypothetical protein